VAAAFRGALDQSVSLLSLGDSVLSQRFTIRDLLDTPLNELLQSALMLEPELRETAPEITMKLRQWARENHLSAQAVSVALINWLTTGTEEAQRSLDKQHQ